jgi:23S rRNA pseudouridine1911/1915/1917 synthase
LFYHERWPVFYEDNHLLVLYKPAGLIMQRDHKNKANLLDLAKFWIKQRYAKPGNVFVGMVHRLDGPVAGIVVVARTSKAAARLSDQFRRRRIDKQYLAVVAGRPPKESDRLENSMLRHGRLSKIAAQGAPGAQTAVLQYHLRANIKAFSLLEVTLETGRRHQIRLQLSNLGCPIVGDVNYGAPEALAHGRIALLACRLCFDHPTRPARLQFETPVPQGWPWPVEADGGAEDRPLWTIEEYEHAGLVLPSLGLQPS